MVGLRQLAVGLSLGGVWGPLHCLSMVLEIKLDIIQIGGIYRSDFRHKTTQSALQDHKNSIKKHLKTS